MIKIILVDDEKLIREGLKILLSTDENIEVVAEASSGIEAFNLFKKMDVDLVLMDIRMPGSSGIDGVRLIKSYEKKTCNILILTTFKDIEYIQEAIELGASGYLLKDSSPESLISAIKTVQRGDVVLDREVSSLIMEGSRERKPSFNRNDYGITEREYEILSLVAQGLNNQEIADSLFLSLGTIKNSISLILSKLDLRDRTQLVIFAYENKIIGA